MALRPNTGLYNHRNQNEEGIYLRLCVQTAGCTSACLRGLKQTTSSRVFRATRTSSRVKDPWCEHTADDIPAKNQLLVMEGGAPCWLEPALSPRLGMKHETMRKSNDDGFKYRHEAFASEQFTHSGGSNCIYRYVMIIFLKCSH